MFKKLIDKLKSMADASPEPFDPTTLNDPVALETDWSPLKSGGANFCTRKLVRVSPHRYEFKATPGAKLFGLLFLLIGLIAIGITVFLLIDQKITLFPVVLISGGIGSVFTLAGGFMYSMFTKPVVFDKQHSCFWKGNIPADELLYATANELLMPFKEIYAIQLISEYISSEKNSYYSYEINLVSREGIRTNVVDHGKLETIRADATTLSDFLEIPVWDGI